MRGIIRQFATAITALYLTSLLFPGGLIIQGGVMGILYASLLLIIGLVFLKPILSLITLPLGMLTLGLFSVVITSFILFVMGILDHGFIIQGFQFPGFSFLIINIPSFHANILLSYVLVSVTIQLTYKFIAYIFDF